MPVIDKDIVKTLQTAPVPKILKRSWIRDGIEDVILEMGGPKVFLQKVWDRQPKEFIGLVAKMLPVQMEVPVNTNLIVMDGNCVLIKTGDVAMPTMNDELPAIDVEHTDTTPEKDTDA
jgi:hypothetical protein